MKLQYRWKSLTRKHYLLGNALEVHNFETTLGNQILRIVYCDGLCHKIALKKYYGVLLVGFLDMNPSGYGRK